MPQVSDLIVVGGGVVGLSSALSAADRDLDVVLVADRRPGQASWAAAGMLAPSIELGASDAQIFAVAARDRYPSYLEDLADRSGIRVALNQDGILVTGTHGGLPGQYLNASEVTRLEPAVHAPDGAWFYPHDGAVDNVTLLAALDAAIAVSPRIRRVVSPVRTLKVTPDGVTCDAGTAPQLLMAAGAWTPLIEGLPRPLPIHPVRGQMLSVAAVPSNHVVYGPNGYLVPRAGTHTLAGSTMEETGYDPSTTNEALAAIRDMADTLCPSLALFPTDRVWAGLRPVTPDFLPIIGRDPDYPSLLYACGHSRNGVLLAPLTADCIAALAVGDEPPYTIAPFSVERFAVTTETT